MLSSIDLFHQNKRCFVCETWILLRLLSVIWRDEEELLPDKAPRNVPEWLCSVEWRSGHVRVASVQNEVKSEHVCVEASVMDKRIVWLYVCKHMVYKIDLHDPFTMGCTVLPAARFTTNRGAFYSDVCIFVSGFLPRETFTVWFSPPPPFTYVACDVHTVLPRLRFWAGILC